MRKLPKYNKKETAFYSLVFLSGLVYHPRWVYDNFWGKADFYNSIPFNVYYWQFSFVYSIILVPVVWSFIRVIKKYL